MISIPCPASVLLSFLSTISTPSTTVFASVVAGSTCANRPRSSSASIIPLTMSACPRQWASCRSRVVRLRKLSYSAASRRYLSRCWSSARCVSADSASVSSAASSNTVPSSGLVVSVGVSSGSGMCDDSGRAEISSLADAACNGPLEPRSVGEKSSGVVSEGFTDCVARWLSGQPRNHSGSTSKPANRLTARHPPPHHLQRGLRRALAHLGAVPDQSQPARLHLTPDIRRDPDRPDRLLLGATIRPGDSGDRHADGRAGCRSCPRRHGQHDGLAHGA